MRGMCRQVFEIADPEHPALKQHREVLAPLGIRQTERGVRAAQVRACFGTHPAPPPLVLAVSARHAPSPLVLPVLAGHAPALLVSPIFAGHAPTPLGCFTLEPSIEAG
jgi:hypothetical protein